MKKRLVSAIMAAALAIVPFTGTGIKAVDNVFNTETTTITASANSGLVKIFDRFETLYTGYKNYYHEWGVSKVYLNGKYQGEEWVDLGITRLWDV